MEVVGFDKREVDLERQAVEFEWRKRNLGTEVKALGEDGGGKRRRGW